MFAMKRAAALAALLLGALPLLACAAERESTELDITDPDNWASVLSFGTEVGMVPSNDNMMDLLIGSERADWKPKVNGSRPKDATRLYERLGPAVVVVRSMFGHGTGFLIDDEGLVVTNDHVVGGLPFIDTEKQATFCEVHLGEERDGRMYLREEPVRAYVLQTDPTRDLALLKLVEVPEELPKPRPIKLARQNPRPGQPSFILGHPSSGLLWTFRKGEISALGEMPRDLVNLVMPVLASFSTKEEMNAALQFVESRDMVLSSCLANPGDSGGPIVDDDGRLLGVTFAIPGEGAEQKFTYHVALDEVKTFLKEAAREPTLLVPAAWRLGPTFFIQDRQIMLAGANTPSQFLFDLDQDTPVPLLQQGDFAKLIREREFDAEFMFHGFPDRRVTFYDSSNDGEFDLVLVDFDEDPEADRRFTLGQNGKWTAELDVNVDLFDPTHLAPHGLDQAFQLALERLGPEG